MVYCLRSLGTASIGREATLAFSSDWQVSSIFICRELLLLFDQRPRTSCVELIRVDRAALHSSKSSGVHSMPVPRSRALDRDHAERIKAQVRLPLNAVHPGQNRSPTRHFNGPITPASTPRNHLTLGAHGAWQGVSRCTWNKEDV